MRCDATQEDFELVTFQGKPALFTDLRIDPATVPNGVERYELRHADEDWGEPCQLARGIAVNHFGTLLISEPIQLAPDGMLNFNANMMDFLDGTTMRLEEYIVKYPPVAKAVFSLIAPEKESAELFYTKTEKDAERGCIGHLRGDMGNSGTEFWTTWHPHQEDRLCTEPFKRELDAVVNWLRQEYGPLHDLRAMKGYCESRATVLDADMSRYGLRIETPKYAYMLRCTPRKGDYNFYLYCYDKTAREQNRSTPEQKPSVLAQLKAEPRQQARSIHKPPTKTAEPER